MFNQEEENLIFYQFNSLYMTAKSLLCLPLFFWQEKIWRLLLLEGTGATSNPCNNDIDFISSPAYTIGINLITEAEPAF